MQSCVVFLDSEDADLGPRFKMAYQTREYNSRFAVDISADGSTWTPSPRSPVGYWLKMADRMSFNECYYLTGQGGNHARRLRNLVTYTSYDLENWSAASVLGMQRTQEERKYAGWQNTAGKQIHLGAALWNQQAVTLGFYGMWDGHYSNDRRLVVMHLGLAVTNDGLNYREPVPDHPIVSAAEDGWEVLPSTRTSDNFPSLIQGQGFENIGKETLFWFASWPEQASDGVRVAVWPRDRLGSFSPYLDRRTQGRNESHIILAPIDLEGKDAYLDLNLEGVGENSSVACAVLDEFQRPVPGYGASDCVAPESAGLRQRGRGRDAISFPTGRISLQLSFSGVRPEDVQLFALYLTA